MINTINKNGKQYFRASDIEHRIEGLNMQYSSKKSDADFIYEKAPDGRTYRYVDLENLKKIAQYYYDCDDHRHSIGEKCFDVVSELYNAKECVHNNYSDNCPVESNQAYNFMKSFVSQKFGLVRVVIQDKGPWFVGKDVATALGYLKPENALAAHVDNEDKTLTPIQGGCSTGMQKTTIINESGLYSLVLSSKLSTAKEFKRWITSEVLPSIRKHGAYIEPQTLEQMISSPEFGIKLLTALKEEQEKNRIAQEENKRLTIANKMLSRQTATWDNKRILSACLRTLAVVRLNGNCQYAYNIFYKELRYKKGICLSNRSGSNHLVDRIRDDEWNDVMEVLASIYERNGMDISRVVNKVNAERMGKHE